MELIVSIIAMVASVLFGFFNIFATRIQVERAVTRAVKQEEQDEAQDLALTPPADLWKRCMEMQSIAQATMAKVNNLIESKTPPVYPEEILMANTLRSMEKAVRAMKNLEQNLSS